MAVDPNNLIWVDLEMTGLEPDRDYIIEIATVVTDSALNMVAEGPVIAIRQPEVVLEGMDEWNTDQHGRSGLLDRVRHSDITEEQAMRLTLEFLRVHVPAGSSPMCGNSVCQDRRFMYRWMRELERFFHYRNLDVSTLKILCQRWAPQVADGLVKRGEHRALEDIHDSIEELRYYRDHLLSIP